MSARKASFIEHELNLIRTRHLYRRFGRLVRVLGPGIVTGAADDDPSGIATYSQTGATYGLSQMWLFPIMLPLLFAVQESCARIGAVTGSGLAAIIKQNYSRKLLYMAIMLVLAANIINIGSDIAAMSATIQLIIPGWSFTAIAVGTALLCVLLQIFVPYHRYVSILKWLALVLFAYPVTAFLINAPWASVFSHTFALDLHFDSAKIYLMVGILGTTISPYLFFWNTSEVVEGEIEKHRISSSSTKASPRISRSFIRSVRLDTFAGMCLAVVSAWFIVIVCSTVLNSHGITHINTAADAAKALEPLVSGFPNAGLVAKLLFSVGILGTGLMAIPVLAGSASYAVSETFGLKEGLYRSFSKAKGFYGIITLATLAGLLINFLGIDPIQALVFTAVFNAVATVPLLWMLIRIGNNRNIMGKYRNSAWSNFGVGAAFFLMLGGALTLFSSFIK